MILADTSVWIDHLHRGHRKLQDALEEGVVLMHPFIIGELACGTLRRRAQILEDLANLPSSVLATDGEVLAMIEAHRLMGQGLGYVDAHLLASLRLHGDAVLLTRDTSLLLGARRLGIGIH